MGIEVGKGMLGLFYFGGTEGLGFIASYPFHFPRSVHLSFLTTHGSSTSLHLCFFIESTPFVSQLSSCVPPGSLTCLLHFYLSREWTDIRNFLRLKAEDGVETKPNPPLPRLSPEVRFGSPPQLTGRWCTSRVPRPFPTPTEFGQTDLLLVPSRVPYLVDLDPADGRPFSTLSFVDSFSLFSLSRLRSFSRLLADPWLPFLYSPFPIDTEV